MLMSVIAKRKREKVRRFSHACIIGCDAYGYLYTTKGREPAKCRPTSAAF